MSVIIAEMMRTNTARLIVVRSVGHLTCRYSVNTSLIDFIAFTKIFISIRLELEVRPTYSLHAGPPGIEPGIRVLETLVLPIILRALDLLYHPLFQLGFGVSRVLFALLAVLISSQFLLEAFALVHRIVLIFADLAAQCNDDAGILLCHSRKG
jgi:hypothetical protein